MRPLTYFIACTADGLIARSDGGLDFFPWTGEHLTHIIREYPETIPGHLRGTLGVTGANRHFDTVLMGRRTYEVASKVGITNPYPHLRQYVFSRSMAASPNQAVQLVGNEPVGRVRELKREEGLGVWLCGGASLAGVLIDEIDELVLKVNPVVLGSGIPLFAGVGKPYRLELMERRSFAGGVAIDRYRFVARNEVA